MSLTDDIHSLRSIELFSDFSDEHLRLIAFGGQRMDRIAGSELYHNGQTADGGYVVLSGEVTITTQSENQIKKEDKFGPSSLLGELSLFTRNRRTGTATVSKDAELLKIRRDVMHRVLSEYPQLAAKLYQRLASNVVEIGKELEKVERFLRTTS